MKDKLKKMLTPKRLKHSIGVCETAVKLAKRYNVNEEKAYIAGLLHDCAKNIPQDEAISLCDKYSVKLNDIEKLNPSLIHAPLGAEIAKHEFNISDEEILDSIRYHTVGRANMTTLEKIIYIADMIEPSRDYEGVAIIRECAKKDLDKTMLMGIEMTIKCNLKKNGLIHKNTIDAWNQIQMDSN